MYKNNIISFALRIGKPKSQTSVFLEIADT